MLPLRRGRNDIPVINLRLNNAAVLFAMVVSLLQCPSLTLLPDIDKALSSR
jgi:hypothetical protein